jgi:hypothetical protein
MPENVQLESTTNLAAVIEAHGMHASDFVDDNGDEISTSLMPENV